MKASRFLLGEDLVEFVHLDKRSRPVPQAKDLLALSYKTRARLNNVMMGCRYPIIFLMLGYSAFKTRDDTHLLRRGYYVKEMPTRQ
eukprot:NODE_6853_length_431_cov_1109.683246_g5249_i0.p2 GENE.NODE_6853_length_431_cov_1109.683246_g5249_i0~~NODE_6853_length_431_cov_1109.683246_g5249_i0.p2  ORF type:complete len:86 (+),score=36.74 NODE_6853_length_431_cov_1109.683246_g5249_i0:79-336(+)